MIEKLEEVLTVEVIDQRLHFTMKVSGSIVFKHIMTKQESIDFINKINKKLKTSISCPITRLRAFPL